MTSIFSADYEQLLKRIESSPKAAKGAEKAGKRPENDFARILADIENGPKTSSDTSALSAQPSEAPSSTPMLSNLDSDNSNYSRASLAGYGISPGELSLSGVKEESVSVKGPPPTPSLPLPVSVPDAPVIISAKRTSSPKPSLSTPSVPTELDNIKEIVTTAGKYHGVDPSLTLAVAQAESSFRPDAVSSDGHYSKGVFQLLDSTASEMMQITDTQDEYDPFDVGMNSFLGVGYLRRLHDMFSEPTQLSSRTATIPAKDANELEKFAVAAFNAGQGRVARAQARALSIGKDPSVFSSIESFLPRSTQEYVARVQESREGFASEIDVALKS